MSMSLRSPLRRTVAVSLLGLLLGSAGASAAPCPGMNEGHTADEAPAAGHQGAHAQHASVSPSATAVSGAKVRTAATESLDRHDRHTDLPACATMSHCAASLPGAGTPTAPWSDMTPSPAALPPTQQLHSASLQHLTPPPRA